MYGMTAKQRYALRKGEMWTERSTWMQRWQDITKFLLPFSGRYFTQDRNKGSRVFNSIYDSEGTRAHRVLASGMMAGTSSPARPWFRLAVADPDLMEYEPVRLWLHDVTELMREVFNKSNTYNALHSVYGELGAFATAVSIIEPDFDNVIHHNVLTAGEYAIACDDRGYVDTVTREFDMTLVNVVGKFVYKGNRNNTPDWSVVSPTVKNLWDTHKSLDSWITVNHIIQPREERDPRKRDAANMRYASCYYEPGNNDDRLLRESGYRNFPVLAPRWDVRGGDIYGHGPSFDALGDIMQLQQEQLRKGQAIDYQTKPVLQVPAEMRNSVSRMLPGGIQYIPQGSQQGQGIRTAFDVNLNLEHLLYDIQDVRQRIRSCFYADLFLMMSMDNRRQPATATEIAEKHEEKLLMLGPVIERLHNEQLSPLIDQTFDAIVTAGLLRGRLAPPPELQGMDLKVEFVSTLAQAQKMVGLGALDRLIGTVAQIGAVRPEAWDKVNIDETIDRYADMLGTDPNVIVADEKVAIVREQRAAAQAQATQAAAMPAMAGAAKDLAAADMSGDNALTNIMQQVSGYNATV